MATASLLFGILVLGACRADPSTTGAGPGRGDEPLAELAPNRPPVPLPERRPSVEREPFLGVVIPRETVEISADLSGRLESVEVRVGDRVDAGDPLARIDVQPLRQELSAAEAALGAASAELSRRSAELDEAEKRYHRRERIPETFSREELEQAALDLETARAALDGAEARLEEQRARVERLRELLGNSLLRAPFRGTVALRHLDAGAIVAPGSPVVRLIAAGDLFVRFAVPADRAHTLQPGSRAQVSFPGIEGPLDATVEQVAPEIDAASRMVFVEARIEASREHGTIRPGLVARVSLDAAPS